MGDVARHTVLDAGAGDGRLAREMASCGAHVVALDRSAAMLCAAGSAAIEARHDAERRRWRQRRERLEYEAARAERQYEACEPENRRVARTAELGTAVAEAVRNA
jgi:2-polyprenyl-3-methyl-5-hydroxy-6-metoxy-1,4-benzoquinol methylase